MKLTYKNAIDIISGMNVKQRLYILVKYPSGTNEWIPVDKVEYLRELNIIKFPHVANFPCEVYNTSNEDGHVYINPFVENS